MRVLLVSFFAEEHEWSSTAQNTRLMASVLLDRGHEVRVVCASTTDGTIFQDGYELTRVPIRSPNRSKRWLDQWLPNEWTKRVAENYLESWQPDIIYMGAWNHLLEFALAGIARRIPVVQMVHDYSVLCLRTWLVDSWGNICTGPTSTEKCIRCVRHGLGWKDKIKDLFLSVPIIGEYVRTLLSTNSRYNVHTSSTVNQAYIYMSDYRDCVSIFIAQAPSVEDTLRSIGIENSRCKLLPQYIGEERLRQYPRMQGRPGYDRPVRFIYVGRWSKIKGTELLIEAFLAAKLTWPIELWIVSRSVPESDIDSRIAGQLGPNKTYRIFTELEGVEVAKAMASSDACVVPSIWKEIAARVVLEANAQGTPVIASSLVGNSYVIEDGVNGRILPVGDLHALRRCFEELSANPDMVSKWSEQVTCPTKEKEWSSEVESMFEDATK